MLSLHDFLRTRKAIYSALSPNPPPPMRLFVRACMLLKEVDSSEASEMSEMSDDQSTDGEHDHEFAGVDYPRECPPPPPPPLSLSLPLTHSHARTHSLTHPLTHKHTCAHAPFFIGFPSY